VPRSPTTAPPDQRSGYSRGHSEQEVRESCNGRLVWQQPGENGGQESESTSIRDRGRRRLGFGQYLADRSPDAANDRIHQGRAQCAHGTSSEEVSIDGCDLLAENDAVVTQPTRPRWQCNTCRTRLARREYRDDYQIVPHPISHVFRHNHGGAGLTRIVRLARREHVPDLPTSRD
jgi:hypothetical protein